ncbi:MAG: DUF6119 family protein [Polyangiaceae bacterium]
MPGFNFFRLFAQQKQNLVSHLKSKGVTLTGHKDVDDDGTRFRYELYFSQKPPKKPVKWVKELQREFSMPDFHTENYSAVVLISFRDQVYALTFGSSHLFVSKYADLDFGIDIAARILKKYSAKNSREFGGVKVKSIETYLTTDEISFEAGEAVNYIKGVPINGLQWGNNVSCGQSVQLRKKTLSLTNAHQMCAQLQDALSLPVLREIPKASPVKDEAKRQALTQQLISDMENGRYMVNVSQQQLSGVAFLFADQRDFVCCANDEELFQIDEQLTLKRLRTLVQRHFGGDYEQLLAAKVQVQDSGNTLYSEPFVTFIDYIDTRDNHYLDEGKWYQFDKNYLGNVRKEVDRINLEHSNEIPTFDETAYQKWLKTHPEQHYRERYLNNLLEQKYGYINHDRSLDDFDGASIEVADLIKGDTIFAVKIGLPQKLNYAIDQAFSAARFLERRSLEVDVNGTSYRVRKVCLWLFLERQGRVQRISEINSLIFLTNLARWRKAVLLAGLQPEIRISYKS